MSFCCKRFFNPNISETIQAKWLKLLKNRKANDLENFFFKMQKFWCCLFATQGRITLELSAFKLGFLTFYLFLKFFGKLCTFERGGTGPPNPPPGCASDDRLVCEKIYLMDKQLKFNRCRKYASSALMSITFLE